MLSCFFIRDNKTLCLETHTNDVLAKLPMICTSESKIIPNFIQHVDRVNVIKTELKDSIKAPLLPLFYILDCETNNIISVDALEKNKIFKLVFFPEKLNFGISETINKEYLKNIVPSVLCSDMGGYFLSENLNQMDNSCLFELDDQCEMHFLCPMPETHDDFFISGIIPTKKIFVKIRIT